MADPTTPVPEADPSPRVSSPRPLPSDERAARAARKARQPGAVQKLVHLTFDRRALLLVIFVLAAALAVQPMLFVNRLVEGEKVFAIDAEGNIIMGPSVRFERSERLHSLIASEA